MYSSLHTIELKQTQEDAQTMKLFQHIMEANCIQ